MRKSSTYTVVVLGASSNEDRYSNKAMKKLLEHGHRAIPVHPTETEVCGKRVYASLSDVPEAFHTLTMYVKPTISRAIEEEVLTTPAKRVIFNPGSENRDLQAKLTERGVEVLEACTLVLLATGQF